MRVLFAGGRAGGGALDEIAPLKCFHSLKRVLLYHFDPHFFAKGLGQFM
jgi:hypothetical protein